MILHFSQIEPDHLSVVGGKGMNLGALARAGFPVPPGYCVTTRGYRAFIEGCAPLPGLFDALDALDPEDVAGARDLGAAVRGALLELPLPDAVAVPALEAWRGLGADAAYAVRSSATAEDLPGASFAGQQDTSLNIRGESALLDAIRRCFASLFTDRAILYRARGGFGHRGVALSVVVQRMVFPDAAGILFTADPVSGHRGTMTIDAGFGLGEALVGGLVNADLYRVDRATGAITELRVGDKAIAIRPLPEGGTVTETLPDAQRTARVLDDAAIARLAVLGTRVESHYGGVPQDLEWCIEGEALHLVQARPITSLFPLPDPAPTDGALHVYFSFNHGQNMTDPITPMGRDLWRAALPFGKARFDELLEDPTTLVEAGGRLYIDVTPAMRLPPLRRLIRGLLGAVYPDIAHGIEALADRPEVQRAQRPSAHALSLIPRVFWRVPFRLARNLYWAKLEDLPGWIDRFVEDHVRAYRDEVRASPPGAARLRQSFRSAGELFRILPQLPPLLGAGLVSLARLRARFAGTALAADVEALQRGLVGNITTEMDMRVGDLADLARADPAILAALRASPDRAGLEPLRAVPGGVAFLDGLDAFLLRFGLRGQGEIDIGRPRWADEPRLLFNSIIGMLSSPTPGGHRAHFARLQAEAEAAGRRLVDAAGGLLGRWLVDRQVRCVRYGLGVREHPKYLLVQCFALVRETALEAAAALVAAGRLERVEDVWFLRHEELVALAEGSTRIDAAALVTHRKAEHARHAHMSPPMVMTSEGEIPRRPVPKDLPRGALAGLGASAGVVEGLARVVMDPSKEVLNAGEILVAPYTDPGWTPLFVHAAGLVCDVGGMMTHGSVVAREYGIPAVVGVGDGTKRLKSGQRLRVDGGRGLVEVLAEAP